MISDETLFHVFDIITSNLTLLLQLGSLIKTKDSLKTVKGQLKGEKEEKNTLTKAVRDLESANAEVLFQ